MLPVQSGLLALFLGLFSSVVSIMVPTGKTGPFIYKPFIHYKPISPAVPVRPYSPPAPVWERSDERDSIYQPPIYKYTALDNARKNNHRTLFPRDEDYFRPIQQPSYNAIQPFMTKSYYKNKFYYSPLQFL